MLEEAKQHCDHMIVGLHSNPSTCNSNKNEPVQSLVERQIQVRACKYIDEIIVYETEEDLILKLMKFIQNHESINMNKLIELAFQFDWEIIANKYDSLLLTTYENKKLL